LADDVSYRLKQIVQVSLAVSWEWHY
jgi:hypothetical protein